MNELLRTVELELTETEIHAKFLERLKSTKIDGFRRDHLPLNFLRNKFGDAFFTEVMQEILTKKVAALQEPIASQIWIEALPNFTEKVRYLYRVQFEVFPNFELQGLDALTLPALPKVVIDDAQIDSFLEVMRRDHSPWKIVADDFSRDGDRLLIDFVGTVDGNDFAGNRGTQVRVELGAGGMLPEFENALRGLTGGEHTKFSVAFPADYLTQELAGKTAEFEVTVVAVHRLALIPLDDDFAMQCNVLEGGLAALREKMRTHLEKEHRDEDTRVTSDHLLGQLAAANPIPLPNSLVTQNIDGIRSGIAQKTQVPIGHVEITEWMITQARRTTQLNILVRQLVIKEEITADPERVAAKFLAVAGGVAETATKSRENAEILRRVQLEVLQDQVNEWLAARARANAAMQP